MAKNDPKEIGKKLNNGSQSTTEIIKKIGNAPLDISKAAPLRESGTTLPPLVKKGK
mgnify:CR=1 FL=1|jgi:hypothetical protein